MLYTEKTTGNFIKTIGLRHVNNEKDYLERISKSMYMSRKLFDNDFGRNTQVKLH